MDGCLDGVAVVAVGDLLGVPTICREALHGVFGISQRRRAVQRDEVVVVQKDQLAQTQMPGQRRCFRGDTLHQVAVTDDGIGVMVDRGDVGAVVGGRQKCLGDGHADRVGCALTQWSGADFDTRGNAHFGVPGGHRPPLPEALELVHWHFIPSQMQQPIEEHRAVTGRQHEAVAIGPMRITRVERQKAGEQHVRHGS